jgi:hypothetical protein
LAHRASLGFEEEKHGGWNVQEPLTCRFWQPGPFWMSTDAQIYLSLCFSAFLARSPCSSAAPSKCVCGRTWASAYGSMPNRDLPPPIAGAYGQWCRCWYPAPQRSGCRSRPHRLPRHLPSAKCALPATGGRTSVPAPPLALALVAHRRKGAPDLYPTQNPCWRCRSQHGSRSVPLQLFWRTLFILRLLPMSGVNQSCLRPIV